MDKHGTSILRTGRREALTLGLAEGEAAIALLGEIGPDDWSKPTDCPAWDIRAMVAHLVGQAEDIRRPWVPLRRQMVGRRRYPQSSPLDRLTAVQVDEHAGESGPDLVRTFAGQWPKAMHAARRVPGLMRRIPLPPDPSLPPMTVGYLLDVIYIRDLWMHRIDLSRAIDRPFVVGAHDRIIVEQVIRDLARDWNGPAVVLELDDVSWWLGDEAPVARVRCDAVAYMRTLSGRDDDPALEVVSGDETTAKALATARVVF